MIYPCSKCGGTGTVGGIKCPRCDGRGATMPYVPTRECPRYANRDKIGEAYENDLDIDHLRPDSGDRRHEESTRQNNITDECLWGRGGRK